jgi:hypothetical protein
VIGLRYTDWAGSWLRQIETVPGLARGQNGPCENAQRRPAEYDREAALVRPEIPRELNPADEPFPLDTPGRAFVLLRALAAMPPPRGRAAAPPERIQARSLVVAKLKTVNERGRQLRRPQIISKAEENDEYTDGVSDDHDGCHSEGSSPLRRRVPGPISKQSHDRLPGTVLIRTFSISLGHQRKKPRPGVHPGGGAADAFFHRPVSGQPVILTMLQCIRNAWPFACRNDDTNFIFPFASSFD